MKKPIDVVLNNAKRRGEKRNDLFQNKPCTSVLCYLIANGKSIFSYKDIKFINRYTWYFSTAPKLIDAGIIKEVVVPLSDKRETYFAMCEDIFSAKFIEAFNLFILGFARHLKKMPAIETIVQMHSANSKREKYVKNKERDYQHVQIKLDKQKDKLIPLPHRMEILNKKLIPSPIYPEMETKQWKHAWAKHDKRQQIQNSFSKKQYEWLKIHNKVVLASIECPFTFTFSDKIYLLGRLIKTLQIIGPIQNMTFYDIFKQMNIDIARDYIFEEPVLIKQEYLALALLYFDIIASPKPRYILPSP